MKKKMNNRPVSSTPVKMSKKSCLHGDAGPAHHLHSVRIALLGRVVAEADVAHVEHGGRMAGQVVIVGDIMEDVLLHL